MCVCVCLCEVKSRWDRTVKGGLSILSIGTAPIRAGWTEGMRYISPNLERKSQRRKSVVKSPASPDVGRPETSHPLRWRFWDVRKLSRMITETEHKMRFVVVAKWVQTPGPHFLLLTTCYGSRAFRAFCLISKLTIEMLKIILMTLIIRFTILKTRS